MDWRRYARLWIGRVWLIGVLALLAGAGAWLVRHGDPKVYEQESSYVVRPSDRIPPTAADNVASTLSQPDSAIVQTVLGILASKHLEQPNGSTLVSGAPSPTQWKATLRPGSNIVDVKISGHDSTEVSASTLSYAQAAITAVSRSYHIYQLESLGSDGPPVQTGPRVWRTVVLAMMLAVLLGSAAVAIEAQLRPGPAARREPAASSDAPRAVPRRKPARRAGRQEPGPASGGAAAASRRKPALPAGRQEPGSGAAAAASRRKPAPPGGRQEPDPSSDGASTAATRKPAKREAPKQKAGQEADVVKRDDA